MSDDDLRHGGALRAMRDRFPEVSAPWIDLSTGINPFAYAYAQVPPNRLTHLPDRDLAISCRQAMASAFGAPEQSLLLAPGSELLIRLLPTILAPRTVAILENTYGDHGEVWLSAGCDVIHTPDPLAHAGDVDAVVLCNPNNPDGRRFSSDELLGAQSRLACRGGWLIIDEAYADLKPSLSLASYAGADGLLILRSFGKFFGLAGLRLGALLAPASVLAAMEQRLGAWPVSGPALGIGAQAYADTAWQRRTRERLTEVRARLGTHLIDAGLASSEGTDLFAFVQTADATALWKHLGRRGIYVRRFSWSSHALRIGLPPSPNAEARLAAALREARDSGIITKSVQIAAGEPSQPN